MNQKELQKYRRRQYRQRSELRLQSPEEAEVWLNEAGLCLFQPKQGVELPSLYGAVAGSDAPAPRWGSHSRIYGRAWDWKDALLSSRRIFYGKALGSTGFSCRSRCSRICSPSATSTTAAMRDDYLELYADGKLSITARDTYGILLENGPTSTTILRRKLGLQGEADSRRFEKGLTELQRGCSSVPWTSPGTTAGNMASPTIPR